LGTNILFPQNKCGDPPALGSERHDEMKGQVTLNIAPSANANVKKSIL